MTGEFAIPERPTSPTPPSNPDATTPPETGPRSFVGKVTGVFTSLVAIVGVSLCLNSFSALCKDGTYHPWFPFDSHYTAVCGSNFSLHGGLDHYTYKLYSLAPKLYWFHVKTYITLLTIGSLLLFLGKKLFNLYVSKKAAATGESFEQTRGEVIAKAVAKQEQLLPTGATTVPGSFIKKLALFVVIPFTLLITLLTLLAGAHH